MAPNRNRKKYNQYMKDYMKDYRQKERELLRKAKLDYGWNLKTPKRKAVKKK